MAQLPLSFAALQAAVTQPNPDLTEEERALIKQLLENSGLQSSAYEEAQPGSDGTKVTRGVDLISKKPITGDVVVTAEREPEFQSTPTQFKEDRTLIPPKYLDLPQDEAGDAMTVLSSGDGKNLIQRKDGSVVEQSGTVASRTNNPGNLRPGRLSAEFGAVGKDVGKSGEFAVFPDKQAGLNALRHWWEVKYPDKPINDAMNIYAPGIENDTAGYTKFLANGIGNNKTYSQLTPQQKDIVINRIAQFEGANKPVVRKEVMPGVNAHGPLDSILPANYQELAKAKQYRDSQQNLRDSANSEYDKFMNSSANNTAGTKPAQQVEPSSTGYSMPAYPGVNENVPLDRSKVNDLSYSDIGPPEDNLAMLGDTPAGAKPAAPKGKDKGKAAKPGKDGKPVKPLSPPPVSPKYVIVDDNQGEKKEVPANGEQPKPKPVQVTPSQQIAPLVQHGSETSRVADSVATAKKDWKNMKSTQGQYNRLLEEEKDKSRKKGINPDSKKMPEMKLEEWSEPAPTNQGGAKPKQPTADTTGRSSGALLPTTQGLIGLHKDAVNQNAKDNGINLADLYAIKDDGTRRHLSFAPTTAPVEVHAPAMSPGKKSISDAKKPYIVNKTTVGEVEDRAGRRRESVSGASYLPPTSTAPPADPAAEATRRATVLNNPIVFNQKTGKWEEYDERNPSVALRTSDRISDFWTDTDRASRETFEASNDMTKAFDVSLFQRDGDRGGAVVRMADSASGSPSNPPSTVILGREVRMLPPSFNFNVENNDVNASQAAISETGIPVAVSVETGMYEPVPAGAALNSDIFGAISNAQQRRRLKILDEEYHVNPQTAAEKLTNSDALTLNTKTTQDVKKDSGFKSIYDKALIDEYVIKYIGKDGQDKNLSALAIALDTYARQAENGEITDEEAAKLSQSAIDTIGKLMGNGKNTRRLPPLIRALNNRGGGVNVGAGGNQSMSQYQGTDNMDSPQTLVGKAQGNALLETLRQQADKGINVTSYPQEDRDKFEKLFDMSYLWRKIQSGGGTEYEYNLNKAKEYDALNGNKFFRPGIPDHVAFGRMLEYTNPANLMESAYDYKEMNDSEIDSTHTRLEYARGYYNEYIPPGDDQIQPFGQRMIAVQAITKTDYDTYTSATSSSEKKSPSVGIDIKSPPDPGGRGPAPTVPPMNITTQLPDGTTVGNDQRFAPHATKIGLSIGRNKGQKGVIDYQTGLKDGMKQIWGNKQDFDQTIEKTYTDFYNKVKAIPDRKGAKGTRFASDFTANMCQEYAALLNESPGFKGDSNKIVNNVLSEVVGGGFDMSKFTGVIESVYPKVKTWTGGKTELSKMILTGNFSSGLDPTTLAAQFNGDDPATIRQKVFDYLTEKVVSTTNAKQIKAAIEGPDWYLPSQIFNLHSPSAANAAGRAFKSAYGVDVLGADVKNPANWNDSYYKGNCGANQATLENDTKNALTALIMSRIVLGR